MHPFTDIICLVHNQAITTRNFVRHLFANTENFRLIFVNNGCNSETTSYLNQGEREGKWKVVPSVDEDGALINSGVIRGRNLGASHITADYFLNIDNDQFVRKNWLNFLHQKMEEGYDIVGSEAWALVPPGKGGMVLMPGSTTPQDRTYFPHKQCTSSQENWTYIGCGGMLIKTEVYNRIGLFDDRFSPAYFEDPDFNFRAIQAGYKIGWCPECPIEHLAHQTFNNQLLFEKNAQFKQSWSRFKAKWNGYYPKGEKNET